MTDSRKPLDAALDLFVFVPVGIALTAAEEIPKLAQKGRLQVTTRLTMAKVVGQFAINRGRHELEQRLNPPPPPEPPPPPAPAPETFDEMISSNGSAVPEPSASATPTVAEPGPALSVGSGGTASSGGPAADGAVPGPEASSLAIPGYDSLSASQVVQRLAGLETEELQAVGAYERSHRGRRTILNRIDQMQAR